MKHTFITTLLFTVIVLSAVTEACAQQAYVKDDRVILDFSVSTGMLQTAVTQGRKYSSLNTATATNFTLGSLEAANAANAKVYSRLEIAPHDINRDGTLVAGLLTNYWQNGYNLCKALKHNGIGWRLPTYRELTFMYIFKPALDKLLTTVSGTPFSGSGYWSATESAANAAWAVAFAKVGELHEGFAKATGKQLAFYNSRCVREAAPPSPLIVIEYGKAPFSIVKTIGGSTTHTYDYHYGEGEETNGPYVKSYSEVFREKPYYKFEIANFDAYNPATDERKTWRELQGTLDDTSDNICTIVHGHEDWRMPRVSELMLIFMNIDALSAQQGSFMPLNGSSYCTSSEGGSSTYWDANRSGGYDPNPKSDYAFNVRCIREIRP